MEYDHTIYVVIPLGDPRGWATDENAETIRAAVAPLIAHVVTDEAVTQPLTRHLIGRVLAS